MVAAHWSQSNCQRINVAPTYTASTEVHPGLVDSDPVDSDTAACKVPVVFQEHMEAEWSEITDKPNRESESARERGHLLNVRRTRQPLALDEHPVFRKLVKLRS